MHFYFFQIFDGMFFEIEANEEGKWQFLLCFGLRAIKFFHLHDLLSLFDALWGPQAVNNEWGGGTLFMGLIPTFPLAAATNANLFIYATAFVCICVPSSRDCVRWRHFLMSWGVNFDDFFVLLHFLCFTDARSIHSDLVFQY